jgi:hypothetical protein
MTDNQINSKLQLSKAYDQGKTAWRKCSTICPYLMRTPRARAWRLGRKDAQDIFYFTDDLRTIRMKGGFGNVDLENALIVATRKFKKVNSVPGCHLVVSK